MKWGILGTSFISGVMAEAINNDEGSELYAVAGRSQAPLEDFVSNYKPVKTYSSYDEVLSDENVDIVYIALPNHVHHEYVIKAAQKSKAILCEKSLSVDMEKTQQALEVVKQSGVFFAEGLMYLNHPLVSAILEELNQGTIGEIRSIQASYIAAISQFTNPGSKGALYNLGCYPMSLLHLLLQSQFGDQIFDSYSMQALGRFGQDGNICESSVLIHFSDSLTAQIHTAEDHGLKHSFTILGSKGAISLDSNPWLAKQSNQFTVEVYEVSQRQVEIEADGDGFFYQVANIRKAIENGKKSLSRPSATLDDSYQIMKLLTDWEKAAYQ
ncbi:Gfo/Idh/MocA family oxidoreductase [Vibrio sp. Isolate25]|uniref:Gfo/Idh/MocA family protein n=1 Tax=Vibrio sp. Isolate25 TaxID=2908535 RepID=UPI001EFE0E26|nr:Gfo/Idh/MocA family oxidoreductase [Vibrio sp. Isolate25]MCG9596911.1 Gfo/Idh/MocA family oxidoreductase [Vibrio sp. Isolate25]